MADDQAAKIETEQSNAIRHRSVTHYPKPQSETNHSSKCGLCGGSYPHKYQCPAKGKCCLGCDKLNHFAKMCRSRSAPTKTPVPKKGYRQTMQRAELLLPKESRSEMTRVTIMKNSTRIMSVQCQTVQS